MGIEAVVSTDASGVPRLVCRRAVLLLYLRSFSGVRVMPTDQPTVAGQGAQARLSAQDEAAIRDILNPEPHMTIGRPVSPRMYRSLLAELDATRAERDALRAALEEIRDAAGRYLTLQGKTKGNDGVPYAGLAYVQQRSTSALATAQPAAPVAPQGTGEVFPAPCCRNWAWAPEMGPYVGSHHPRCETVSDYHRQFPATTPPDHQATTTGDGADDE